MNSYTYSANFRYEQNGEIITEYFYVVRSCWRYLDGIAVAHQLQDRVSDVLSDKGIDLRTVTLVTKSISCPDERIFNQEAINRAFKNELMRIFERKDES